MKKYIEKNKLLIVVILLIISIAIINGQKIISKLGLNDFSVQCWIKIESQKQGEKYLTISDGKQEVALIAHLQDENGQEKGIVLSHNNGEIYGGNDYLPEYNTYSFFVINYKNNKFELYLNGEKVGEQYFSECFDTNKMAVSINVKEELIKNYITSRKSLSEKDILDNYLLNKVFVLDNIDYNDSFKSNAQGKVSLPLTRKTVNYQSSNTDLMYIEGKYLYFSNNEESVDKDVSLFCEYEDIKKEINFIIKGNNKNNTIEKVKNKLNNMFYHNISESDTFPSTIDGINIKYEPKDKSIRFVNNKFIDLLDREKTNLDLLITIDNLEEINVSTTLLNEYYGYLIVYFAGQAKWPEYVVGDEEIRFSLSKDLKSFKNINNPNIKSLEGSNRFRDPFITRLGDEYIILSTQAFYNPGIYVSRTNNFKEYSTEIKNITDYSFDIGLRGNYSWSPECFFDKYNEEYVIYYSDSESEDASIFAVTTEDFVNFSSPFVLFNAGYKIIDAHISEINGGYYLFYKDERDNNKICYASTNNLSKDSTWVLHDEETSFETKDGSEGPFVIKNFSDNNYYLYIDLYGKIYSTSLNIENDKLICKTSADSYIGQIGEIRHFSIIPITKQEYNLLLES